MISTYGLNRNRQPWNNEPRPPAAKEAGVELGKVIAKQNAKKTKGMSDGIRRPKKRK